MIYDLSEAEAKRLDCRMVPMVRMRNLMSGEDEMVAPTCAGSGCAHWLETLPAGEVSGVAISARGFCALDAARVLLMDAGDRVRMT